MENLLIFFYILISVSLVLIILLQQGKGSDIGSAFGAGSSNTMFGTSSSSNPLTKVTACLLYTSPSPRDAHESRMPSSA